MSRPPLTIAEAAQVLGVSDKTVRRMLGSGQLSEHSRDAGGRILLTPESIDATAVRMGRKVTAREEVREIAPALNANAEASRAAVHAFAQIVEQQNQRIYDLMQRVAELEAERKYLPTSDRVQTLEQELARARAEIQRWEAAAQTTVQTPPPAPDQPKSGLAGWLRRRLSGKG